MSEIINFVGIFTILLIMLSISVWVSESDNYPLLILPLILVSLFCFWCINNYNFVLNISVSFS